MNRRQHRRGLLVTVLVGLLAASGGTALADEAPKPSVPTQKGQPAKGSPTAKGDKGDKKAAKEGELVPVADESPEAKAGRGIVVIQRGGQPVGLGTVLAGDGRILTALSPLGSGNDLEARFADDTTAKLKLGHHDRVWDLALLVPQSGRWTDGLAASSGDPLREGATIRAFSAPPKGKPLASPVDLRARRSLIGGDDKSLENALELGSKINAKDLGSPLIDEKGRVVGVLGRACLPIESKPCAPVAFGIPVPIVKSFLKTVPADALAPTAWLGIQGAPEVTSVVKGVRVLGVAKGSPAADAKLRSGDGGVGDVIVAVAGEPVTTPEELAAAIRKRAVGEKVQLTLFGKGLYRHADVVLRAPPEGARPPAPAQPPAKPEAPKKKPAPKGKAKPGDSGPGATPDDPTGPPHEADPFSDAL